MGTDTPRELLRALYETAVAAAHPDRCLPGLLPPPPDLGRLIVLACGKAAAAMARTTERHYRDRVAADRFTALAVTRHGYGATLERTELMEAGHPVPDAAGVAAAGRALVLAEGAGSNDLVLVLMSGGASALWTAPAPGLTLADKQQVTRALLASGAPIHAINCVRKHLSRIKGGRLARSAAPARVMTLAISDVPGDAPGTIGSGPTVGDPTTLAEARDILARYGVSPPDSVAAALASADGETPKPDDPLFTGSRFVIAAAARDALAAACRHAADRGYQPMLLGDALEGEARLLAREHAALARRVQAQGRRTAILSGGEMTVTLRGDGRGGPNQEYALALAIALDGAPGIAALAGDTDGSDGGDGRPDDPAGAVIGPDTLARATSRRLDAARFLEKNDSTGFFEVLDDLIIRGPTATNVNDFRVILVDPLP